MYSNMACLGSPPRRWDGQGVILTEQKDWFLSFSPVLATFYPSDLECVNINESQYMY